MVLSIRNNLQSLSTNNYLNGYERDLEQSYKQVGSGLDIVHPKDDTAKFVSSEQLRTQIASLKQAYKNNDTAISMVQTAESGLDEVNRLLVNMRQVAIHSANDAANDSESLAANQQEINDSIQELDTIFNNLQFGKRYLFKTESGTSGAVNDGKVKFIAASEKTKSSGVDGYALNISTLPTASSITAKREMDLDEVETGGATFTFISDAGNYEYKAYPGQSAKAIVQSINNIFSKNNVDLKASISDKGIISVKSVELGSGHSFKMSSSLEGLFSEKADELLSSSVALDAMGTINGEQFVGKGAMLFGKKGGRTEGLQLQLELPYAIDANTKFDVNGNAIINDELPLETLTKLDNNEAVEFGRIHIKNNALTFHAGSEAGELAKFHLPEIDSKALAKNVVNASGFENLNALRVDNFQGAQDSLLLLQKAIDEVTTIRGKIGSFQKNLLEENLDHLAVKQENVIDAESKIRDMDMAMATVNLTRQKLQKDTAAEALRSSNIRQYDVLRLFRT